MQRTKNFSHKNYDEQLLSQTQRQMKIERQAEQKFECRIIEAEYNVTLEAWKQEGYKVGRRALEIPSWMLGAGCENRRSEGEKVGR